MSLKEDKYAKEICINAGFDFDKLTENQIYYLTMPNFGPENFYQDGELTASQAKINWKNNLKRSGLTDSEIKQAVSKIL